MSGALLGAALSSRALAAEPQPSTVVLPTSTEGEISAVALDRIDASLRRGLSSGGLSVVDGGGPAPCVDAECLTAQAQSTRADTAVQLRLVLEGRDYHIELLATDRDGKLLTVASDCAICGFDEAATVVGDSAATLAAKLAEGPRPAAITVATNPVGAIVYVDGERVGTSPLSLDVPAGEHELRMQKEGYHDKQAAFVGVGGVKETMTFEMVERVTPRRTMRVGGWLAVSFGAASLATGAGLLAVHGQPVRARCDDPANIDGNGLCRYQHTSIPVGSATLAAGSAGVAMGVVLLIIDRRRRKADQTQARIIPTGLGLAGRF